MIFEKKHEQEQPQKEKPSFIKRSGIIPYFRELSIVIIGILITLSITSLINNYNRQKELTGMLKLVKEELKVNREDFKWVKNRFLEEQHVHELLIKNQKDITKIPADTLKRYSHAMGAIYAFEPKKDSYEVLKSSVLKQYLKEKDLEYKLSSIYNDLSSFNKQLVRYSDKKILPYEIVTNKMSEDEMDYWLNGDDIYFRFSLPLKERTYRNFIVSGATIFSPEFIGKCEKQLDDVINEMEQYGY